MKKLIALLLALVLTVSLFAGCGKQTTSQPPQNTDADTQTPEQPQLSDEEILQARRDAAMEYARRICTVRWRSDETVTYKHNTSSNQAFVIVAGRLYEGLPYSYAGSTVDAWLDQPGTMDENGIYNITGLNMTLLHSTSTSSRIGVDCSGVVNRSWQSFGSSIRPEATGGMTSKNGFLHVGDYEAPDTKYENTVANCTENGKERMYAAYELLQKSDALVKSAGSSGHALFVVGVNVVRDETGAIDGTKSTVTVLDQNGIMRDNVKYFDEKVGEDVYVCMRVDYDFTFLELFDEGYLPVTCKELVDPAPLKTASVVDTLESKPGLHSLFSGSIGCNYAMDMVKITITDKSGNVAQSSVCHPIRKTTYAFNMSQFLTDSEDQLVGVIETEYLPMGDYHCTVTARTVSGETFTAREFDFTVDTPPKERPKESETEIDPNVLAVVTTNGQSVMVKNAEEMAALADESGNTVITLNRDVNISGTVAFSYSCTIDLNGYTWNSDKSNCIVIARAGKENPVTVLKNGTVKHAVVGLRVDGGGFVVSNVVMKGSGGANVCYYDNSGKYNEHNLIENSVLVSEVYGAVGYNKENTDFTGTNITIRDTTMVCPQDGKVVFIKRTGATAGTITFGPGVTMYTKRNDIYSQAGFTFAGETPALAAEKYELNIEALGLKYTELNKWTTSASSSAPALPDAAQQAGTM